MKTIILNMLFLVVWLMSACSQISKVKSNNLILPVFNDSTSFMNEVRKTKGFKDVYEYLQNNGEYA